MKGIAMEGKWLTVLEYASFKNKSISTVRRYIKANRVKFKEENGKYLIWTKNFFSDFQSPKEQREVVKMRFEIDRLQSEIKSVKEENEELKMLINILEQKLAPTNLPDLPELPDLPI
jgi:cell shape-determining protein MreC